MGMSCWENRAWRLDESGAYVPLLKANQKEFECVRCFCYSTVVLVII